mmetsp:Transcript_109176/g.337075  ORF Transcript_109176/g.337075 Transcript_109176/m.337075 type:complete len:116 (-) Transcript_109176:1-348(-)
MEVKVKIRTGKIPSATHNRSIHWYATSTAVRAGSLVITWGCDQWLALEQAVNSAAVTAHLSYDCELCCARHSRLLSGAGAPLRQRSRSEPNLCERKENASMAAALGRELGRKGRQ